MSSTNNSIGNYQIIRKIASGPLGHVYLAYSTATPDRSVILKLFHVAYLNAAQDYERFRQEIQILTTLKHPFVLPILDVGIDNGFPYLVTEYAPNGSLRGRLRQQAPYPLPAQQSFTILTQIGQALYAAHQQGILHGDLKPENVLFNFRGEALLADFTLPSILAIADIQFAEISGSLPYMAPEQRQGMLTRECDQYALGCIAYELVTGQQPFATSAYPIPPTQLNSQLPAHVGQAILKAMAQQPTDRHADIAAFLMALGASALPQATPSIPTAPLPSSQLPTLASPSSPDASQQGFPFIAPQPGTFGNAPSEQLTQPTNAPMSLEAEAPTVAFSSPSNPAWANPPSSPSNPTWASPPPSSSNPTGASPPFSNMGTPTPTSLPNAGWAALPPYPNAGSPPSIPPAPVNKKPNIWRQRLKSPRFLTLAILALVLLIILGSSPFTVPYLLSILPASSATVTITPASKTLNQTYTISAVTGTPNASQKEVAARMLSYTSPTQTRTVKATGRGHANAVQATGTLTFFNPSATITINFNSTLTSASGVQVSTDGSAAIQPGGSADIPAHAIQAGVGGNISVFDINSQYSYVNNPNVSFSVQNRQAFTGGADAQDYTFVQQSDIDAAANPLEASIMPDAQAKTEAQVHSNEQLAAPVQCTPTVSADHPAGSHATSATIKVSVKCVGEAYDKQAALSMATTLLMSDANSNPGPNYALVGEAVTHLVTQFPVADSTTGAIDVQVSAMGVWVFQFSAAQQHSLAQSIAGKPQSEGIATLLKQAGVLKANITTSGFGNALPSAADAIKFVVMSIPGLHATA